MIQCRRAPPTSRFGPLSQVLIVLPDVLITHSTAVGAIAFIFVIFLCSDYSAAMSWIETSAGVEEWQEDASAPATPRKLTLAEQIAATRAKVKSEAMAAAPPPAAASEDNSSSTPQRKLTLAEQIAATRAKEAGRASAGSATDTTSSAPPRKLTLAEQIAATRAKASSASSAAAAEDAEDAAEARARRYAAKQAAEAAEAEAERRAEEEAARAAKAEADAANADAARAALAELETAAAEGKKLTLAEQIAVTRARVAREAAEARAKAAAEQPPLTAAAAGEEMPSSHANEPPQPEQPKQRDIGSAGSGSDGGSDSGVVEVPEHLRGDVEAAVAAGRVDEVHMLLAKAPPALRTSMTYKALRKELMKRAEASKAAIRAGACAKGAAGARAQPGTIELS
jgi:hypothetical protein